MKTKREFPVRDGLGKTHWGGESSGVPELEPTWVTKIKAQPDIQAPCVVSGDVIVLGIGQNQLLGLSRITGEILWQAETQYPGMVATLHAVGDLLIAGNAVLELESGELVTRITDLEGIESLPKSPGTLCGDDYYVAVDSSDMGSPGKYLRIRSAGRQVDLLDMPVRWLAVASPSGELMVGMNDMADGDYLQCVSVSNREIVWSRPGDRNEQLHIVDDSTLYLNNPDKRHGNISKIDVNTGELQWDKYFPTELGYAGDSNPGIGRPIYTNETIHLSWKESIVVVAPHDGSIISIWPKVDYLRGCVAGDVLFGLGYFLKNVMAYDRFTGEELWRTTQKTKFWNVCACHDNVICIDGAGVVYCYNWSEEYVSTRQPSPIRPDATHAAPASTSIRERDSNSARLTIPTRSVSDKPHPRHTTKLDAFTKEPTAVPAGPQRYYDPWQITLAAFFGTLLAGAMCIGFNFSRLGNRFAVFVTLAASGALILGGLIALDPLMDSPYTSSVPIVSAVIAGLLSWATQWRAISQRFEDGAEKSSFVNLIGLTLFGLLMAFVLFIFV